MHVRKFNYVALDASENAFLQEQFLGARDRTFDVEYPEFKARRLIPMNSESDPGAVIIPYNVYDRVGSAKLIASYADDLPRADVLARRVTAQVRSMGDSFGWNLMEIRIARRNRVDLDTKKLNAARYAMEKLVEDIAATGDSENGLLGLLNQPNANVYTVPAGASTDTEFSEKTADEMLADLFGMEDEAITTTNGLEPPDTLLMPNAQLSILKRTRVPDSNQSVLRYFLEASSSIKNVESWEKCVGAGSGATDRMVAYRRDPNKVEMVIPQEFETLPPEPRNLEFVVSCHGRIGGVLAYFPLSITYGDGI